MKLYLPLKTQNMYIAIQKPFICSLGWISFPVDTLNME